MNENIAEFNKYSSIRKWINIGDLCLHTNELYFNISDRRIELDINITIKMK